MQAIILAAGMGRRLGALTAGNTKCMLEVNGYRLIDRVIDALAKRHLERIVIVVGYAAQNLIDHVSAKYPDLPIHFIHNDVFDHTNNIYSLWLAKDYLTETDTLLLESDLIFEESVLDCALLADSPNVALVAKYQPWMDGTMVKLDADSNILTFIPKEDFNFEHTDQYYKTVNIYKISRRFAQNRYLPFLEAYIKAMGNNEYYEQVLRVLTMINTRDIKAVDILDRDWYEIDDIQDLKIAEAIFADPDTRYTMLQHSYGGFWRFPGLIDFCYLVNPYFPTPKMIDEIKANLECLIHRYPSGMAVNSLLAGKYFGVDSSHIVVGNGAAELIKELIPGLQTPVAAVIPTFEEYLNRLPSEHKIFFRPAPPHFRYDADRVIKWCLEARPASLVIVNPDNPSGNLIPRDDLLRLIDFADEHDIRLVIDESFVDFSTLSQANSIIDDEILTAHPRLIVIKSISKSYGVAGLRLGVLASGDRSLIADIKSRVAIWNINSIGEFYMQIFGKYQSAYADACRKYAAERDRMAAELAKIPWLDPAPSQANFILARIDAPFTARQLAVRLLADHNIFIKDCSGKLGFGDSQQYIRLAVRDRHDNDTLISALKALA